MKELFAKQNKYLSLSINLNKVILYNKFSITFIVLNFLASMKYKQ